MVAKQVFENNPFDADSYQRLINEFFDRNKTILIKVIKNPNRCIIEKISKPLDRKIQEEENPSERAISIKKEQLSKDVQSTDGDLKGILLNQNSSPLYKPVVNVPHSPILTPPSTLTLERIFSIPVDKLQKNEDPPQQSEDDDQKNKNPESQDVLAEKERVFVDPNQNVEEEVQSDLERTQNSECQDKGQNAITEKESGVEDEKLESLDIEEESEALVHLNQKVEDVQIMRKKAKALKILRTQEVPADRKDELSDSPKLKKKIGREFYHCGCPNYVNERYRSEPRDQDINLEGSFCIIDSPTETALDVIRTIDVKKFNEFKA